MRLDASRHFFSVNHMLVTSRHLFAYLHKTHVLLDFRFINPQSNKTYSVFSKLNAET